jgi:hypothetical protein
MIVPGPLRNWHSAKFLTLPRENSSPLDMAGRLLVALAACRKWFDRHPLPDVTTHDQNQFPSCLRPKRHPMPGLVAGGVTHESSTYLRGRLHRRSGQRIH